MAESRRHSSQVFILSFSDLKRTGWRRTALRNSLFSAVKRTDGVRSRVASSEHRHRYCTNQEGGPGRKGGTGTSFAFKEKPHKEPVKPEEKFCKITVLLC